MVSIRSETSSLRRFLVSHNNSVTTIGEMEIHRRLHLKVGGMEKIYQMHWLLYLLMHEEPLLMHYKLDWNVTPKNTIILHYVSRNP